jgi:hypothetical protein
MGGLTAAEASRQFDIPAARIRQWIHRGHVKRRPDGLVDLSSLIEWIDRDPDPEYWVLDKT